MEPLSLIMNIAIPATTLLVALLAIGIVVKRLYRRASKQTAFVRTGMGGQKVVVNGGCLVLPVLHETIAVNMNTLRLEVARAMRDALITRDRMRVDVRAEFYVRVQPTEEAIAASAQTLGHRTLNPQELKELVEGKFIDGLRATAAGMGMEELHEKRTEFVRQVQEAVAEDLLKNGLELESVSLTGLDQTSREYFDPDNAFDAAGLTRLTEQIEERRKSRNAIERETAVEIAQKDLETQRQQLEIRRESEYASLEQEREVETRKAQQNAQIAAERAQGERNAEQARIEAHLTTERARIGSQRDIESARIEQAKTVRLAEQEREIAVAQRSEQESAAKANADRARADAIRAEEQVITAQATEQAERAKSIELVRAHQNAEQAAIAIKVAAETERNAAEDEAAARRTRAEAEAMETTVRAHATSEAAKTVAEGDTIRLRTEAEGTRALNEAHNVLSEPMATLRLRMAIAERIEGIVRESVRPMDNIESIKILQLDGAPFTGTSPGGENGHAAGPADGIVTSALRYRAQAPLVDAMLAELGLNGTTLAGLSAGARTNVSAIETQHQDEEIPKQD